MRQKFWKVVFMSDEINSLLRYKRVKHFNTAGHLHFLTFSCFERQPLLANELWKAWLGQSVRAACDKYQYALWAYVFMPEHVHALLQPTLETYNVSDWLKSVKNSVAKKVKSDLARQNSSLLEKLTSTKSGKPCFHFWQQGPGYDKNIWSMEKAIEKAQYCHLNPVKRHLIAQPDLWRWSSFRWLELGARKDEPLHVDDWTG
jgi:putative transposase